MQYISHTKCKYYEVVRIIPGPASTCYVQLTMYTGAGPFIEQLEFMGFVMFLHTCTCIILLTGLANAVLVRRLPVVSYMVSLHM